MKILLLLVALLVAYRPGATQTLHPATRPDSVAPALAAPAPDTLAALHRLFAAKRRELVFILIGTAAAEVAGQVVVSTTVQSGGIIDSRVIYRLFVIVLTVPVVVAEVLFYTQYDEKHEAHAVEKFRLHRLPHYLKHKLRARYFR